MKEPEKAKALKKDLSDFAIKVGFNEDDLSKVTDHRLVLLLNKAMLYDKAQAKAPQIKNKIDKALESSAPGSRTTPQKVDKAQAAKERLRKSGSIHDGAAVLTALLED
jgi:predicted  nucleic acid-binding Zn-ribbon protein